MELHEIVEKAALYRVDSILMKEKEPDDNDKRKKFEEEALPLLEPEARKHFERYGEVMNDWSADLLTLVYKQAFLDGLLLAHLAF